MPGPEGEYRSWKNLNQLSQQEERTWSTYLVGLAAAVEGTVGGKELEAVFQGHVEGRNVAMDCGCDNRARSHCIDANVFLLS